MNSCTDVLILGGGTMGLATAIELARQGVKVTILSRNFKESAVHAAAGMLAPQAEGLTAGPMLDLCLRSRSMYVQWVDGLEQLTGLDTGYWPCGILAPLYEQLAEPPLPEQNWLTPEALQRQQPGLSAELTGGWWFPADAQVNNRALAQVLYAAAQQLDVKICEDVTVTVIKHNGHQVLQVDTTQGTWQAQTYILATGAWSADVLPVPVFPRKGQLLSVRPQETAIHLKHVLFGSEIYLVPRQDGQIIVGATSEDVGFSSHNTPAGIQQLLTAATRLFPAMAEYIMEEFWWGFRPATPDELPILGTSPYENLILATGHYRNGILLTPITAALIAQLVVEQTIDPLLKSFSYQRFNAFQDSSVPPSLATTT
ncbi:MAG: glycine oxidase ThiO [Thermosynechococcaceae cyanobacterium]